MSTSVQIIALTLKPQAAAAAVPAAAFISGNDPAAWLRELGQLGLALEGLELFVVPTSVRDRTPAGLFVVSAAGAAVPEGSPRVHRYKRLSAALFIPLGTVLRPELDTAERDALFAGYRHLLHPSLGHVGFELKDRLRPTELVEAPCPRDEVNWHGAHPGNPPATQLLAVRLALPGSAAELLEESKGDIGSKPLTELPPAPGEKGGTAGQLARAVQGAMLTGAAKIDDLLRAATGKGGAAADSAGKRDGGLRNWLNQKLTGLEELRHKELNRLVHLLESNPEEGLKYALPLDGPHAPRGLAAPGIRLHSRQLAFSLWGLGGGTPVDPWAIRDEMRRRLHALYLASAKQAVEDGNHDRAAYIYAQLLGDYHTAAGVLKSGRRFQEAALIYRDYLKRPLDAAACLREGGLLAEAAELYAEHGQPELAGDLLTQLGQVARGRELYRRAVQEIIHRGDHLRAADLMQSKLHDEAEADRILVGAWPGSADAIPCMLRHLQSLEQRGDDKAFHREIQALTQATVNLPTATKTVGLLGRLVQGLPREELREQLADTGLHYLGSRLDRAGTRRERAAWLSHAAAFAPQDRVLARDVGRYQQSLPPELPPARKRKPPTSDIVHLSTPERRFQLPPGWLWTTMASEGETGMFLGLGAGHRPLVLLQSNWTCPGRRLAIPVQQQPGAYSFCWPTGVPGTVYLYSSAGGPRLSANLQPRLDPGAFERSEAYPDALRVLIPPCLPQASILGVCPGSAAVGGVDILHFVSDTTVGGVVLSRFRTIDEVIAAVSHLVGPGVQGMIGHSVLWSRRGESFAVLRDRLCRLRTNGDLETVQLSAPAHCAAMSTPFLRTRLAVSTTDGLFVYHTTHDKLDGEVVRLSTDFQASLLECLPNCLLVAARPDEIRVYSTTTAKQTHTIEPLGEPVALARGPRLNDLAILYARGDVALYDLG